MMGSLLSWLVLGLVLVVVGCAPAERRGDAAQYHVNEVGPDVYQVSADGDETMPWSRIEGLAVYRAAKSTIAKNKRKFRVLNARNEDGSTEGSGANRAVVLQFEVANDATGEEWHDAQEVIDLLGPKLALEKS